MNKHGITMIYYSLDLSDFFTPLVGLYCPIKAFIFINLIRYCFREEVINLIEAEDFSNISSWTVLLYFGEAFIGAWLVLLGLCFIYGIIENVWYGVADRKYPSITIKLNQVFKLNKTMSEFSPQVASARGRNGFLDYITDVEIIRFTYKEDWVNATPLCYYFLYCTYRVYEIIKCCKFLQDSVINKIDYNKTLKQEKKEASKRILEDMIFTLKKLEDG